MRFADLYDLKSTPGAEVRASCGCAFVYARRMMIDARRGCFVAGTVLSVVPCSEDHHEVAREVAQPHASADPDSVLLHEMAEAMSERIAA